MTIAANRSSGAGIFSTSRKAAGFLFVVFLGSKENVAESVVVRRNNVEG